MAAESNLWVTTRSRLIKAGFFVQRIEDSISGGVPDVWVGHGPAHYAWLENKAQREWPARATSKVFGKDGLRPGQVVWLMNAARCGVRAYIWAGVGQHKRRKTFLVPASLAEQFNDMTQEDLLPFECSVDELPNKLKEK